MALGNMELMRPVSRGERQRLNTDTSRLLHQVFSSESDRDVRFEIVKAFALAGESSAETRDIIERTLAESDAGILQYAIMGVATLQSPELLPQVIVHLQHASPAIRMAAATTSARLADSAQPYHAQLEAALAKETREEIRQILRTALKAPAFQ
jgi:hypothetical protein